MPALRTPTHIQNTSYLQWETKGNQTYYNLMLKMKEIFGTALMISLNIS